MQLRVRLLRLRFVAAWPVITGALLAACSGNITNERPADPPQAGKSGTNEIGGPAVNPARPGTGLGPAATCSGRTGRPAWQLSTNTAFQVGSIVVQVFGPTALEDAQVRSLLENLP